MSIPMNAALFVTLLTAISNASASDQSAGGLDGFVSGAVGQSKSSGTVNPESSIRDIAASVAYTDTSKWGGQLDYVDFQQGFKGAYPKSSATDIAGHLYFRDSEWLLGGFVQKRKFTLSNNNSETYERFQGIEGQLYRENTTLYGQLGNEKWSILGSDINGHFVAAKLTYFLNDNLNVSGGIDLVRENQNGYTYNQNNYKIDVEGRMTNSPLGFFAGYMHIDEKDNFSWNVSTNMFMVGAKLNFGKSTLRSSGREGASLMPAPRVMLF